MMNNHTYVVHDVSVVVDKRHWQCDHLSYEAKARPCTSCVESDAHSVRLAGLPQPLVQVLVVHFDGGHRQRRVVVDVAVIKSQLKFLIYQ